MEPQNSTQQNPTPPIPAPTPTPMDTLPKTSPSPRYMPKKMAILILVIIGFIFIGGLAGTYFMEKNSSDQIAIVPSPTPVVDQVACTMDVKECPDGSFVGRTGPKCEFTPCPKASTSISSETTEWQTYSNSKYGLSLKYPKNWKTAKLYSPDSQSYTHLNLGLVPAQKVKTGYEYVFAIEHYDNPDYLTFQEWDKKENEGKNMPRNLYSSETKTEKIAGYTAYVNEKGNCHPVLCKEIIIMNGNDVIVLRNLDFTNMDYTKDEIDSYKPIFDQMLSTIKLN